MSARVLVLGDALLDRDVVGTVERLCPDAPVPVVDERQEIERPGGAALAALLAARAGADVTLICSLADDAAGRTLQGLLEQAGVRVLACPDSGRTAEKTRVRVEGRSLVRIDRGEGGCLGALPPGAGNLLARTDAVLAADYGRGMLGHEPARALMIEAVRCGLPTVWDPHPRGGVPIAGVTLAVPNAAEAERFDGSPAPVGRLAAAAQRARRLRTAWSARAVAVKLGPRGAVVAIGEGPPLVVPVADPTAGMDTCGAGDAFAATAAAALARRAVVSEAVTEAVTAASAFVAAGGAAELGRSADDTSRPPAGSSRGGTLVAAGGCFDMLHAGHVATLEAARALGDRLVVLLNSDASVRRLKGPGRPVQQAADRAAVLRSLRFVDDVIVFDDDTPVATLRLLRPDVFVKGGDYTASEMPETAVLAEWGGVVVTAPYLAGRSTTRLLDQIAREHVGAGRTGASHVG